MNGCAPPARAAGNAAGNRTSNGAVCPTTASLLRAAFPGRGLPKAAGREFGLHPDTVRHWASGRVVPGADRLLALAARHAALRRELLRVLHELEEADGG